MKKIMIIAVHPDDETLGCGGTLLKHIDKGDRVSCVFVTCGNERQNLIVGRVVKAYGFESVHYLKIPELSLTDNSLNDIIPSLAAIIREYEPEVLYIPNHSDVHSDHRPQYPHGLLSQTHLWTLRTSWIERWRLCRIMILKLWMKNTLEAIVLSGL